jgi:hypothetical protein
VTADQLLERAYLVEIRVIGAVDEEVADVGEPVEPTEMIGGPRTEDGQRVLAIDSTGSQMVDPVAADRDGPQRLRPDENEADAGVGGKGSDESRVALLDLLE